MTDDDAVVKGAAIWAFAVCEMASAHNFRVSGRILRAFDVGLLAAACSFPIAWRERSREVLENRVKARAIVQRLGTR